MWGLSPGDQEYLVEILVIDVSELHVEKNHNILLREIKYCNKLKHI
jgi:hypothetical protein